MWGFLVLELEIIDYVILIMLKKNIYQIYGINGMLAVLANKNKYNIKKVDILKNSAAIENSEITKVISKISAPIQYYNRENFNNKFKLKRTQGIVITFEGKIVQQLPPFEEKVGNFCLLMLNNLSDPQNFGQIIRTAECAGVDGIIIPARNSIGISDTVLQVSQGAFCTMPIYEVTNLNQTIDQLKQDDFWTIAIENGINAEPWSKIDYSGKIIIIVGGEGPGINQLVLKSSDFHATIPMQGKASSLNVSAAVSAIVFERLRQISMEN